MICDSRFESQIADWRVPNPPGANLLVAERAFPTSDYWGCTGVARCAEEATRICRISNRLLTPCHTRLQRPPWRPFSYQGVSTRGVRHSPGCRSQITRFGALSLHAKADAWAEHLLLSFSRLSTCRAPDCQQAQPSTVIARFFFLVASRPHLLCRVFSEWGHPNQHRIANVDPSKRNMISHIFFVNEKSAFLLSSIMADHL